MTPTCKIQLAAAAAKPPPGQESWQERIWARGRTRRQAGTRGDGPPCANLLSSRSLSARNSRSSSSAKTWLHSFQLQPALPAPLDRHGRLCFHARKGFPALLSSAFPSCAKISSKSQQTQESQQVPPGEPVTVTQEGKEIHL